MSGGGVAGGEEAARKLIKEATKKLIKSLKEIRNRPLPDITAALRDCGMDADKAVIRLLFPEAEADQGHPLDENKDEDEDSPSSTDDMSLRDSTPESFDDSTSEDEDVETVMKKAKMTLLSGHAAGNKKGLRSSYPVRRAVRTRSNSKPAGYKGKGPKKNTQVRPAKQFSGFRRGNTWFCKLCDRTFVSSLEIQLHKEATHPTA